MSGALAALSMGLVLGLQHATDADHVAAVSTIVASERRIGAAARIGIFWGLGHSATVLLAGGAMIASGVVLPERAAQALEMLVAIMLVVLGVTGIRRAAAALRGRVPHPHPHSSPRGPAGWRRPAAIGIVHGLAGSAALALAVLATVRDQTLALGYLTVFCGGTILGMALVTAALATPVALAAHRLRADVPLRAAIVAGGLSILCGVWLGYRVAIVDGLFLGVAHAAVPLVGPPRASWP